MATNEFVPTGGSPREADDSDNLKSAIAAAVAEHDDEDDEGEIDKGQPAPKDDDEKPGADEGDDKKPEVKEEQKTDDKVEVKEVKKPEDQKADDKGEKKEGQPAVTEPPTSWSAEDKATFKTLPKAGQEFVLKRYNAMEADYTRKTQDLASVRKDYEAVDQIFTPQREKLKAANLTPSQVIQGWANAEMMLMNGKGADFLPSVAKSYKIDPAQLAYNVLTQGGVKVSVEDFNKLLAGAADAAKANKAAEVALPPEVLAKLAKVDSLETFVKTEQQSRADAEMHRINADLDKFKAAIDDKGALLHPYFDELIETMSQLVEQAMVAKQPIPPHDQLYQNAIFANPVVRQKFLDAREAAVRSSTETAQQTAREKAAAEARAKSEKARKAGSSVTGSPGTGQPLNGRSRNDTGNLRSAIAAAVEDQDETVH